jgi:hypothetical protein
MSRFFQRGKYENKKPGIEKETNIGAFRTRGYAITGTAGW